MRKLLLALLALSAVMFASPAYASQHLPLDAICRTTPEATVCKENTKETTDSNRLYGRNGILTKVMRILSTVVGIVSIFVIIIAGVTFMTSGGDSTKVNKARESIMYAAIGLALVAFAQSVIIFVLNKL